MPTPPKKRGRLSFDKEKAKQSVKPALVDAAAAFGGGAAGAGASQLHPLVPFAGGLLLIYAGNYSKGPKNPQSWMQAAGAGMLASTAWTAINGAATKTAKPTFKDRLSNGKDQAISFITQFAGVFGLGKKKAGSKGEGMDGELGYVDSPDFAALDQLERSVLASAMDYQNQQELPEATHMLYGGDEDGAPGLDFDKI